MAMKIVQMAGSAKILNKSDFSGSDADFFDVFVKSVSGSYLANLLYIPSSELLPADASLLLVANSGTGISAVLNSDNSDRFIGNSGSISSNGKTLTLNDGTVVVRYVAEGLFLVETAAGIAQTVSSQTTEISSAEILNLGTTAKLITPEPPAGSNLVIIPSFCVIAQMNAGSAAYATNTGLRVRYKGAANPFCANAPLLLATTTTLGIIAQGGTGVDSSQNCVVKEAGLEIFVWGGNPTGGNGTLTVTVSYSYGFLP